MAGAMKKMAVYLGLVEDDQFDDELYYEGDDTSQHSRGSDPRPQRDEPVRSDAQRGERYSQRPYESRRDSIRITEEPEQVRTASADQPAPRNWRVDTVAQEPVGTHPAGTRSRPRPAVRSAAGKAEPKITTLHPRSYNDARRIGEDYRGGSPVIMNLTDLEDVDAKRIVDFAAGLVFGLRGSIERVTNKVFLLSPANVDVTEEARAQLAQAGLVKH